MILVDFSTVGTTNEFRVEVSLYICCPVVTTVCIHSTHCDGGLSIEVEGPNFFDVTPHITLEQLSGRRYPLSSQTTREVRKRDNNPHVVTVYVRYPEGDDDSVAAETDPIRDYDRLYFRPGPTHDQEVQNRRNRRREESEDPAGQHGFQNNQ